MNLGARLLPIVCISPLSLNHPRSLQIPQYKLVICDKSLLNFLLAARNLQFST